MHYSFCSSRAVSHYLPWELRALTFGLCVCHCIYIYIYIYTDGCFSKVCLPLFLPRCVIASVVASDLSRISWMILIKLIKMWMHLFVLRLCPFVSFLLLALSHSLRLAFFISFCLFPSRLFLFTAVTMSPQSATVLMESKVPSWGNLVPSYVSGSAVIVLSI